jgi:hypothetical protein
MNLGIPLVPQGHHHQFDFGLAVAAAAAMVAA